LVVCPLCPAADILDITKYILVFETAQMGGQLSVLRVGMQVDEQKGERRERAHHYHGGIFC